VRALENEEAGSRLVLSITLLSTKYYSLSTKYYSTRWEHLKMKKLGLELPMRAKGVYPPHPAIQGVRRLGGKKVFRAGVFCIVAAFRLWRLQPWGLRTYLER
jgi:hypothetical protein